MLSKGLPVIKAISLWQPWASLIAIGAKLYETRHWETPYRGPLVIHAAKRMTNEQREFCESPVVFNALKCCADTLPLGEIVAVVNLDMILPTHALASKLDYIERCFGDFSHGRRAWRMSNARQVVPGITYKGRQGLFSITEPDILHQLATYL